MNVNHHKKKVCFVSSSLSNGGAERALSNLLCNMDLTGLDIQLLLLNKVITYPIPENVTVVDLRKRSALYLPLCFIMLMFHLMRIKPDVVISIWSFPSLLTGLALKITRLKSRWIVRIANNPADQEYGIKKRMFNWLYQHADEFIVLCDELKEKFIEYYPFSKNKTHLIRNGFNLDDLNLKASEDIGDDNFLSSRYIVSVGSLSKQKRYDVLLRAFALIEPHNRIPLLILGDGPLKEDLKALAEELEILSEVIFKGFVKNPYPYVKNAQLFVLASDYEGLCNAAIEAQCLGIPAVITDCPTGNKEIVIDNVTGYLTPIGRPEDLAMYIAKVLTDGSLKCSLGEQAKLQVGNNYKIETSAEALSQLIKG